MTDRKSWLDDEGGIAIDAYARQLESFLEAMADGVVSADEIAAQETRVAEIMREIEPQLDDAMHEQITKLLCEMTVYDIMQLIHTMQEARGKTRFEG
jgi:predicted thioredoxin/glutaredoxin